MKTSNGSSQVETLRSSLPAIELKLVRVARLIGGAVFWIEHSPARNARIPRLKSPAFFWLHPRGYLRARV